MKALHRPLRGLSGHTFAGLLAASLMAIAVVPAIAAPTPPPTGRAERELLGIRLWNRYSDVLARFGQPTRIENGLAMMGENGGGGATGGAPGGLAGGPPSMGMPGAMGGGAPSGMNSLSAGSMTGGTRQSMNSRNQMMGGMMGGDTGGGMPGMPGMAGMGSSGMMGGGMMGSSGMMGGGMAGMGGGMPGMTASGTGNEAHQTWIYQRGIGSLYVVFNKDGRVVQIEASTPLPGIGKMPGVTSRGVAIGDPLAKVYRSYGWAKMDRGGASPILNYFRDYHVGFQLIDTPGRGPLVQGISVSLLDNVPTGGTAAGMAGGMPGMGGGAGSMMGMPGMGGGAGSMMGMPGRGGKMSSGGGGKMQSR